MSEVIISRSGGNIDINKIKDAINESKDKKLVTQIINKNTTFTMPGNIYKNQVEVRMFGAGGSGHYYNSTYWGCGGGGGGYGKCAKGVYKAGGGYYCPGGGINNTGGGGGIGIWDENQFVASYGSGGYNYSPPEGGVCIIQYYLK